MATVGSSPDWKPVYRSRIGQLSINSEPFRQYYVAKIATHSSSRFTDAVEYSLLNAHQLRFHTYFLFPFSVHQSALIEEHPKIWEGQQDWFEKLAL